MTYFKEAHALFYILIKGYFFLLTCCSTLNNGISPTFPIKVSTMVRNAICQWQLSPDLISTGKCKKF